MRILATFNALLLVASLAHAGPVDDCNQVHDLNRQLRGCTAYIKQGKATPENLATAYLNRANIYAQRGKYPLAFANYASAIKLDPRNPLAPYNRGNAYLDIRQHQLTRSCAAGRLRCGGLDQGLIGTPMPTSPSIARTQLRARRRKLRDRPQVPTRLRGDRQPRAVRLTHR
jgi:tetratricopeptide (TPR) repeat protein